MYSTEKQLFLKKNEWYVIRSNMSEHSLDATPLATLTAANEHYSGASLLWCRRLVELVTAAAVACCHELK